jgi:hypothetical protein
MSQMTHTPCQLSTTTIRLIMDPLDQAEHNQLHRKLRRQSLAREEPSGLRRTINQMLNITAAPKSSALEGLVLHIKNDQTIVFCRNSDEHQLVLTACHNAGKDPYQLTAHLDQHRAWTHHGGVLAAVIGPRLAGLRLIQANQCIYFSRPPSTQAFINLKAQLHHKTRRKDLQETHIITLHSADKVIADALMRHIWN